MVLVVSWFGGGVLISIAVNVDVAVVVSKRKVSTFMETKVL